MHKDVLAVPIVFAFVTLGDSFAPTDAIGNRPLRSRNDVYYVIASPGVGKTFLAKIIAWRAGQANQRVLFTAATCIRSLTRWLSLGVYSKDSQNLSFSRQPQLMRMNLAATTGCTGLPPVNPVHPAKRYQGRMGLLMA